jgi:hypothetical protein
MHDALLKVCLSIWLHYDWLETANRQPEAIRL